MGGGTCEDRTMMFRCTPSTWGTCDSRFRAAWLAVCLLVCSLPTAIPLRKHACRRCGRLLLVALEGTA
eukprot:11293609-Alexandrium_andersonii.AAC.2